MSTIIVNFDKDVFIDLQENASLIKDLISTSSLILEKKPSETIVIFQPFTKQEVFNSPAILIKGETSVSRKYLIKNWAEGLLSAINRNIKKGNNRIAVKTYVLESEWIEL